MIILIDPNTSAADDRFRFYQSKVIISYCYFSFYGVYLYNMLTIPDCCQESYYWSLCSK